MIEEKMTNILLVEDDEVDVMNKMNGIELLRELRNFVEAVAHLNKYWTLSEIP